MAWGDHPKVSVNCCWALMNILEQLCLEAPEQESSMLSRYYETFIPALVQLSNKEDNEYNSRASAYEALSSFVTYSANDCMGIVSNIATEVLSRLEATIAMQLQVFSVESRSLWKNYKLIYCPCWLLWSDAWALGYKVTDKLMTMFIKVVGSATAKCFDWRGYFHCYLCCLQCSWPRILEVHGSVYSILD